MKNKELNLVEILKDFPEGTKLYSPLYGECTLQSVSGSTITITYFTCDSIEINTVLNSDGRYISGIGECMLFPSKENRDWSIFKIYKKFKKGDFIVDTDGCGNEFIMIIGNIDWEDPDSDAELLGVLDSDNIFSDQGYWGPIRDLTTARFATTREKKLMIKMIEESGMKWDEENLQIIHDIPIFNPFDKVLVRDTTDQPWKIDLFSTGDNNYAYPYKCLSGSYRFCVLYEGHEYLLGTN